MSYKIGQRVEVSNKDCQGVIAYIGYPTFASGKWIGVILDEPKGKNNGTIKGQSYFKVNFMFLNIYNIWKLQSLFTYLTLSSC